MAGNAENDGGRRGRWRKVVWGTAAFLWLAPLIAMPFTPEVNWVEIVECGVILLAAVGAYELALALRTRNSAYRIAVGIAIVAAVLLGVINGAVGIIGSDDEPANLLYSAVFAVGIIGCLIARFRPRGMARALLATALATALVPVIALIAQVTSWWGAASTADVIILSAFFVVLFVGSAWMFHRAAHVRPERIAA